jgi:hypothetical protein
MTKRTITLYKFRELGPVEKKKALDAERIYQRGYIQEMIEALFEMYLKPIKFPVPKVEIDFDAMRLSVWVDDTSKLSTGGVKELEDAIAVAREELPILMGDEYMTAHIEADDGWYLKSGDLWVYGEAA